MKPDPRVTDVALAPTEVEGAAVSACLHLDPDTRRDAARRLRVAKGHLEGVIRMLDDESVYCVDVLKQVKAVTGALSKVNAAVLKAHIRDHVATAALRGDTHKIVDELMEALKYRT